MTAAHVKFLLLHDGRGEEAIKSFFRDVYDAYLRVQTYIAREHEIEHELCDEPGKLNMAPSQEEGAWQDPCMLHCERAFGFHAGDHEPLLHAHDKHQVGHIPAEGPSG